MQKSTETKDSDEIPIIKETVSKSNGESFTRTYTRGGLLGKGGFASVYEFYCQETGEVFAGKVISKSTLQKARARQKLMFEIKIHRSLHHNHIVEFIRYFEDQTSIYILLELCSNQTMNELVRRRKRLTELEIQSYLSQLISALKYLHSHRIIHRDIKLGNLFLNSKMEIKLGDFGLATKLEFDGERKSTVCGTPNYIAPEIIDGQYGHSYEVDVWSLGVLTFTMLVGKPPFETSDIKSTYKKIRACAYSFPSGVKPSKEFKDLLSKLIISDPSKRLTLDEILYHEFMTKNPIPKNLPASTLAVPPKSSYLKQFQSKDSRKSVSIFRIFPPEIETKHLQNKSLPGSNPDSPHLLKDSGSATSRKIAVLSYYEPKPNTTKNFVKKWVDYSNKYGLGYVMSNNFIGVYFNDHSKFICNERGEFQVIQKKKNSDEEVCECFSLEKFPDDLKKKVTLLEHFRKYLICQPVEGANLHEFVYIKKWLQTEHATIFRLSDKTVQIRFMDLTELVLSSGLKTVAFLNKNNKCDSYPMSEVMQSGNEELIKRINYTSEMISRMLSQSK